MLMETINVTLYPPKEKHPAIIHRYDILRPGESFAIQNDHDPKPLYYQMVGLRGETFNWEYITDGPDMWEIKITKLNEGEKPGTIADMVLTDPRKVAVFKKYGLDFCCGGKRTLSEACAKKGVDIVEVEKELRVLNKDNDPHQEECDCWDLDVLVDYIITKHHAYVREGIPQIQQLASKIATVHGANHPELEEIYFHFNRVANELSGHMNKEEAILFPYIQELQRSKNEIIAMNPPMFGTIQNPIHMMEMEHESAGEVFEDIKRLTNNYTPPNDACNSYRVTFNYLKEFEEDLHRHIHLENNILFPKAIQLEEELLSEVR